MRFEKHRPGDATPAGCRRLDQMIFENSADRAAPHFDIHIAQGTLNPSVTPTRMVVGHSYDELFDIDLGVWAVRLQSLEKGPFLGYERSISIAIVL